MIKRTLFFGNPAYLSTRNQQLVINLHKEGEDSQIRTVPIEDIGMVVIENPQITITAGVLDALLCNNSAVITCDSRRMPSGLFLPLDGNNIQSERFHAQIEASLPLRKQLWQQTMQQKIANQAAVLQAKTEAECGCMFVWSKSVKSGDSENLEGRAAVYYWKNIFPGIDHFKRDRNGCVPNNMLNYGYAILRGIIARALVSSGLLPTLGIHHKNRYNAYCLADDVMEPYRPCVDRLVIEIMEKFGTPEELSREIKASLLQIPTLDVMIRGKRSPLMIAASMTTASLAKCFEGELRKIDYPVIE